VVYPPTGSTAYEREMSTHLLFFRVWPSITFTFVQGDHLSGKPGNVREFDNCLENVRDFTKSQGNVGKNLVREK